MYQNFDPVLRTFLRSYGTKRSMIRRRKRKVEEKLKLIGQMEREIRQITSEIESIEAKKLPLEKEIRDTLNTDDLSISLKWGGVPKRLTSTVLWGYGKRNSAKWRPKSGRLDRLMKYSKRNDIVIKKKDYPSFYDTLKYLNGKELKDRLEKLSTNDSLRDHIKSRFLNDYLFKDKVVIRRGK